MPPVRLLSSLAFQQLQPWCHRLSIGEIKARTKWSKPPAKKTFLSRQVRILPSPPVTESNELTGFIDNQKIRLSELPQHGRDADTKWVVCETSVYDITDFIESHPGGEVILRACGGTIDPYWKLFTIHQKPEVRDILNEMYIGDVDDRDLDSAGQVNWKLLEGAGLDIGDPFKDDPERDPSLVVHTAKPCNAETPGSLLSDFLTPLHLFFVRNHLWVPQIDPSSHELTIELSNGDEKSYSLADLKEKFREHTVTVTLQCAGNRRAHMSQSAGGKTAGLQWDFGAIGTAEFTGVRLRDVLIDSGYDVNAACEKCPNTLADPDTDQHVQFIAPGDTYAASVPLPTALNPAADVILAWNMNGEPMPRDHGGPLRAVVPGIVAARSVKWVGRISISNEEAQSQWQKRDYKCFGPNVRATEVSAQDWDDAQSIQETPVQSAITKVFPQQSKNVTVEGFAYSGGGRAIVRVDVSADGGRTWKQADLRQDNSKGTRRWSWTLWNIEWPQDDLPQDQKPEFVVKAVDDSYNCQPKDFESIWNFRGLLGCAWHRVPATV